MLVDEGDHVGNLAAPYVLGALEPEEVEIVELHIARCADCRALVDEERKVTGLLPYLAEPQPVPLRARRALLDRIQAETELEHDSAARPRRLPSRLARLSWIAAAFAAVVALAFAWTNVQMQSQVDKKDAELAVLESNQEVVAEFVDSQRGFVANFQGRGAASDAGGGVFFNPTNNTALLLVKGMPKAKQDHSYVVWMVRGNQHVNVGMLPVTDNGSGQLHIAPREAIVAFDGIVITEESGPLVASPSGTRLMMASVEN